MSEHGWTRTKGADGNTVYSTTFFGVPCTVTSYNVPGKRFVEDPLDVEKRWTVAVWGQVAKRGIVKLIDAKTDATRRAALASAAVRA